MEIEEVFGLPAHPLVVHAAVVLLPLAAVVTLVCAAVPRARRSYALVALGLALVAVVAVGLAQGSGNLMLRAMVGDVADQDRLKTGQNRTALFFSVFSTSAKAAMAVAVGVTLPLVAWLGFDPKAATNTPEALRGLLLVFALGPAAAHLVSALLVAGFPLDAKAHAAIRSQLAERDAAAPAA